MLLGADVGLREWWLWNQIPVTVGNIVGGLVFTGMALHGTHRRRMAPAAAAAPPAAIREELAAEN